MSKADLFRLDKTKLFHALLRKESDEGIESLGLSAKVVSIVKYVTPLLAKIPEHMPEYTLHDANHSAKIVEIMGKIIPQKTINYLNTIELTLLILSAYLHDIGMTCSRVDKEIIMKQEEDFQILFKSSRTQYEQWEKFESKGDTKSSQFIKDQVFTEYLRKTHVKRSAQFIEKNLSLGQFGLTIDGISFHKWLINICDGHGLPVKDLKDKRKFPRKALVGSRKINVQYLSLILRLADILDLDPERTPRVVYEFINPQNPISILEWRKHRSIVGHDINTKNIEFAAECSSPKVERALRLFIDWIEIERRDSINLLNEYNDNISKNYFLELNEEVTKSQIASDGSYIYNDLKFEIHYERIIELLMGERLYKNPVMCLRELLQNSMDAIKVRQKLYEGRSESFEPLITITLNEDVLIIEDNGIGMDETIFKNYFLQVGKSFYSSPTFFAKYSDVEVVSEFGIGILSCFMIASSIIIESWKDPEFKINAAKPIYYEIPTAHSYTISRESTRRDIGTKITLKLKSYEILNNYGLREILKQLIPKPPFKIKCLDHKEESDYLGIDLIVKPVIGINSFLNSTKNRLDRDSTFYSFKIEEENPSLGINGEIEFTNNSSYQSNKSNFVKKGFLTRNNFSIGIPNYGKYEGFYIENNLLKIFPEWIGLNFKLNFNNSSKLLITPDRTDVIKNENYYDLKTKLEKLIIKKAKMLISNQYQEINEETRFNLFLNFFYKGFLSIGYISRMPLETKSFFESIALFKVINDSGKLITLNFKDTKSLKNLVRCTYSGTLSNEEISKIKKFVRINRYNIILYDKENQDKIKSFFELLGSFKNQLIGPIPYFEFDALIPTEEESNIDNFINCNDYYDTINKQNLLLYNNFDEEYLDWGEITGINFSHDLFPDNILANDKFDDDAYDRFYVHLDEINKIILDSIIRIEDNSIDWKIALKNKEYITLMTNIFNRVPNLFNQLLPKIESIWNFLNENNLVNEGQKMPKIESVQRSVSTSKSINF